MKLEDADYKAIHEKWVKLAQAYIDLSNLIDEIGYIYDDILFEKLNGLEEYIYEFEDRLRELGGKTYEY